MEGLDYLGMEDPPKAAPEHREDDNGLSNKAVASAVVGALIGGYLGGPSLAVCGAALGLAYGSDRGPQEITAARRQQIDQKLDDQMVFNAVQNGRGGSAMEIADATGLDMSRVDRSLERLQYMGLVSRVATESPVPTSEPITTARPTLRLLPGGKD